MTGRKVNPGHTELSDEIRKQTTQLNKVDIKRVLSNNGILKFNSYLKNSAVNPEKKKKILNYQ